MGCSFNKDKQYTQQSALPTGKEKQEARRNNQQYVQTLQDLSRVPLLRYLPNEQRPILASCCITQSFNAGETVMQQGEIGTEFFLIREGQANVFADSKEGKPVKVAEVSEGDYFGEHALLFDEPRNATIVAVTKLQCLKICRDRFHELGLHKRLVFPKRQALYEANTEEPTGTRANTKHPEEKSFIVDAMMQNQNLKTLGMTTKSAGELADIAWLEEVHAGQEIITQGDDDAKYFYIVASGTFDIFVNSDMEDTTAGKQGMQKVESAGRGGSFGELALIHSAKRAATVRSTMKSSVWVMDRGSFKRAVMKVDDDATDGYEELLSRIPVLNGLLQTERRAVANAMTEMHFNESDVILKQGDPGDTFYVLCEGEVSVSKDGKEVSKLRASKSSKVAHYFGERALVNNEPRGATVQVISRGGARALALDKNHFDSLLKSVREDLDTAKVVRTASNRQENGAQPLLASVEESVSLPDLKLIGILGTGAFGKVELHEHKKTLKTFAVKVMSKGYIVKMRMQLNVVNEKLILGNVNSPFIVRLHMTSSNAQELFFIMEPCLGGEVFSLYERRHLHGHEYPAKYFSASVTLAFEHLHERFVIYRDLKPENLLLDSKGHMKVTDMGLAKFTMGKTYTTCGTREYFAPEIIQSSGQTRAVDWWTLGILIFEFMTGGTPFWAGNDLDMYAQVLKGIDKVTFPTKAKGLPEQIVKDLVQLDPAKRLPMGVGGASRIKKHAWFRNFDWDALANGSLKPPYTPTVKSNKDLQNFSSMHKHMKWIPYKDDGTGWDAGF